MKLYSYIVKHDTGFSPNPFLGYCTLACCKPAIRRTAQVKDWIVGLTPRANGNRIVYFMQIDETMEFRSYWKDRRFREKRPRYDMDVRLRCGDNIYEPQSDGSFRQLRSRHSDGAHEDIETKEHDLGGKYVLVSETFAYFGSKALELPPELKSLIAGRGYKSHFSDEVKERFFRFVSQQSFGVHAPPRRWPEGDKSWKSTSCG